MSRKTQGFTLIELMIVIAIIAIIAAIAIPGLLQSQRASNERNASASMKTLATAESDFRANDRDGNRVQDFWTRDVAGLYTICPILVAEPIKLLEISVAGADSSPQGAGGVAVSSEPVIATFTISSAKAGYWYIGLTNDEDAAPYRTSTSGTAGGVLGGAALFYNGTKFGFMAYPDSRSAGRNTFWVNEGNTIFKRGILQTYLRTAGSPPGAAPLDATDMIGGAAPLLDYPTDVQLQASFSKMD